MRVWTWGAKTASWRWFKAALFLAAVALVAHTGRSAAQAQLAKCATSHTVPTALSEIDDPHTRTRWLLMRDPIHPGGPGRLAQVVSGNYANRIREMNQADVQRVPAAEVPPRPVIRGGDRLIVEENTATIEARLEAVALGAAVPGGMLQARLKIGSKVVRVVALSPGRAALAPEIEVRP